MHVTEITPAIKQIAQQPLFDLISQARARHSEFHEPNTVTLCAALSIKTGACAADCKFCSQSAYYQTFVSPHSIMSLADVLPKAQRALELNARHFCLGGAWDDVPEGVSFKKVLKIVEGVSNLGLSVCCSLGSITLSQARDLKKAGASIYNHNLDACRNYHDTITDIRSYDKRLKVIEAVFEAGLDLSCGGILGLGESEEDRVSLISELANLPKTPAMIPLNMLVPVDGTPLSKTPKLDPISYVRTIALARILMPSSIIALAGGRHQMDDTTQALCFMAGANALYFGETILTTPVPSSSKTEQLLDKLNLRAL